MLCRGEAYAIQIGDVHRLREQRERMVLRKHNIPSAEVLLH